MNLSHAGGPQQLLPALRVLVPLRPFLPLQDAAYHCTAALFYLSASVLEALATIQMHEGFTYKQYHENISAVVSPCRLKAEPRAAWPLCSLVPWLQKDVNLSLISEEESPRGTQAIGLGCTTWG